MRFKRFIGLAAAAVLLFALSGCVGAGNAKPDIKNAEKPANEIDPKVYGEVEILWRQDVFSKNKVLGFNIYRSKTIDGPKKRINKDRILYDSAVDNTFEFYDHTAKLGELYYYHIEIISRTGLTKFVDPIPQTVNRKIQEHPPEITNDSIF